MTGPELRHISVTFRVEGSEDQKYVCIYRLKSCGRCPRMPKLILRSMQIHVVTFNRLEGKWFWPPVLVSFRIRWTIPWNIVDLLDTTMLAYSYLKMSSSHFMSGCRIRARRTEVVCGLSKRQNVLVWARPIGLSPSFIELSFSVSPRDYFNPLCQTGSGTPPL